MTALFETKHDFFVGVDSDGCTFDTMEVKHKECFIPNIIQYYRLAAVSKYAREAAEFVNLYSKHRGINRFPALVMAMDLLADRPEVQRRNAAIPTLPNVRRWIETESKLSNQTLAQLVKETGDGELTRCLEWSKAVNDAVEKVVHAVPPFPLVRESLERLAKSADVLVVSATPNEALNREWAEHGIKQYTARICGQEIGSKKELLADAKKYPAGRSLMIGDAPGDFSAARANQVLFFPINPGAEEESWRRFHDEGLERFLSERYAGDYEKALIADFEARLPATPPWKN